MSMVNEYTIPTINVSRNAFECPHSWKGTCNVGLLYPIFFDEAYPGDTKDLNTTIFGRLNPTVTPVLDNVWCDIHYFFVPNRLVWDNWQKFMGERKNPGDSIDYLVPSIKAGADGFTSNELIDCFSVPPGVPKLSTTSLTFYLRAYNLIWNEWYRSELLQDAVTVPTGDTGDSESIYKLLPRGKRQDYFTSALPSPQLGVGSSLPLGTAPLSGSLTLQNTLVGISSDNNPLAFHTTGNSTDNYYLITNCRQTATVSPNYQQGVVGIGKIYTDDNTDPYYHYLGAPNSNNPIANTDNTGVQRLGGWLNNGAILKYESGLAGALQSNQVNLDNAYVNIGSVTINSLRQAIAIQQFLEREMMRGTRYIEQILSFFGVRCPDYRLQRPEYLGGGTSRVNINPVVQTSSTNSTSPQGNLTGNGTVGSTGNGFVHSFTEHGVVLGLMSFRVDLNYQQGVDRRFLRKTRYDYFFPQLAHLGMQSIYNKEIYAQGDDVVDVDGETIIDDKTFGYQLRYNELRYKNSYITGKFRSSNSQSLDIWHLAEDFENLPVLNDEFITVSDTLNRVMAVQDEPELLVDVWHDYTNISEVPMYGMPGLERI